MRISTTLFRLIFPSIIGLGGAFSAAPALLVEEMIRVSKDHEEASTWLSTKNGEIQESSLTDSMKTNLSILHLS